MAYRLFLPLALLSSALPAAAISEYDVKAAFLLNFTKFVEWPSSVFPEPDAPITLCVSGKDPFGRKLDDVIAGEVVGGRKLSVRRLADGPVQAACNVLFIDDAGKDVQRTLSELPAGVLTVGEGDGFLHSGGIIAFVIESGHVRFDINQTAASKAGLKLSSRLLNVARKTGK